MFEVKDFKKEEKTVKFLRCRQFTFVLPRSVVKLDVKACIVSKNATMGRSRVLLITCK